MVELSIFVKGYDSVLFPTVRQWQNMKQKTDSDKDKLQKRIKCVMFLFRADRGIRQNFPMLGVKLTHTLTPPIHLHTPQVPKMLNMLFSNESFFHFIYGVLYTHKQRMRGSIIF